MYSVVRGEQKLTTCSLMDDSRHMGGVDDHPYNHPKEHPLKYLGRRKA